MFSYYVLFCKVMNKIHHLTQFAEKISSPCKTFCQTVTIHSFIKYVLFLLYMFFHREEISSLSKICCFFPYSLPPLPFMPQWTSAKLLQWSSDIFPHTDSCPCLHYLERSLEKFKSDHVPLLGKTHRWFPVTLTPKSKFPTMAH